MAQPTASDVHPVDALLTNISIAYMQEQESFIATKVFPVIPVDKKSNKYATYTKADWFRDEAALRTGSAESAGSGYTLSNDNYNCDVYAIHKDIDYQTRANADAQFDLDADAARFVMQRILLRREIQWATDYFGASIWGTDLTPANLWSDYTSSDPAADIDTGKRTVLQNTGLEPNTLVLGYQVYQTLRRHPDIKGHFGLPLGAARQVSSQMLADFFEVERLFVAKGVKVSSVEAETVVQAFVAGKHALLCYVPPNPGLLTPAAGYTFAWKGANGEMPDGAATSIIDLRPSGRKVDRVECEAAWDNKVVATDLGYFFASAIA